MIRFTYPKQFVVYTLIGALATILDWVTFYVVSLHWGLHYMFAVLVALAVGFTTKFILNKIITFKDTAKNIYAQYAIYFLVVVSAVLANVAFMYLFVDILHAAELPSRMSTTMLVLLFNYALDKHITFKVVSHT